jgi:fatty-acid desaturase
MTYSSAGMQSTVNLDDISWNGENQGHHRGADADCNDGTDSTGLADHHLRWTETGSAKNPRRTKMSAMFEIAKRGTAITSAAITRVPV